MRKLSISFFLFILFCLTLKAQNRYLANYSTESGLPQSQVLCIFQDAANNLWIGTNSGGAAIFNGHSFKTYNITNGLIDNYVFSITQLQNKKLIFGTSKGLSIYNGFEFKNYSKKNGLTNEVVYNVAADGDSCWIGTAQGACIYYNGKITAYTVDPILANAQVYRIYKDSEGNIWFGTQNEGLAVLNKKTKGIKHFNTINGLNDNFIYSINDNLSDKILIGTRFGLNFINKKDFSLIHVNRLNANNGILCISKLNNETLFLGTQSLGSQIYDKDVKKKLFSLNGSNGLTNAAILCSLTDSEGNLWIGTDGVGLFKYTSDKFTYYSSKNGFANNYINTVAALSENEILVANQNEGVALIKKDSVKTYKSGFKKNHIFSDNNINCVLKISKTEALIGTNEGLNEYKNGVFSIYSSSDTTLNKKYILSLLKDSKGRIFAGTTEGLYYKKATKFEKFHLIEKYAQTNIQFLILFLIEDNNKTLWAGTETGLINFDENNAIQYNHKNGLINGRINCADKDFKNNIWVGTEEGLFVKEKSKFKKIIDGTNLTSQFINVITAYQNKLLIGTNNGIVVLDLEKYYSNNTISTKQFTKEDGLISLESNANAIDKDETGKIYIGTVNGLLIFDPKEDKLNKVEAKLCINSIKLFYGQENIYKYCKSTDSTTTLPIGLNLPYHKNNITFNFSGICLTAPEKVNYQFMLKGLDENWGPVTTKNEVTYSSLPPGEYTFILKAQNNDGLWNKKNIEYSFVINPPWYKTWWFYSICVIVVLGSITSYNKIKTKKLVADRERLEQVVNVRTKELREEKEKVELINKEVTSQKALIEEKQNEIISSINYAKRIQSAVLSGQDTWDKISTEHFIFFNPRDIVSGDFYWASVLSNNLSVFCVADCTGHGVPGGFMSMLGNSFLNEIVVENNITKANKILNKLREKVITALDQKGESLQKDGMDMALCVYDSSKKTIDFAGANNSLYLIRDNNIKEFKGNKMPIGTYLDVLDPFTSTQINIEPNDWIYLSTDGFPDQFGGPKGKKFKYKQLEDILINNSKHTAVEQKQMLKTIFDVWRGEFEQTDDVCLLGIKLLM
ncbi:MAG: SpoIIE family protein phosphatase [Bacteroidetes bacterium]|nr:SpoIIE family protein phosphatase [Bacteroidota bacterium]